MIHIQIGANGSKHKIEDVKESWIHEQINRRRHDGAPVCVRVYIQERGLDLVLATCDCPRTGGRRPTEEESGVFQLWESLGLNRPDFTGNQLIRFLRGLR